MFDVARYRSQLMTWTDAELLRVYRLGLKVRWIFARTGQECESFDTSQNQRFNEIMHRRLIV
jgi:hypothetical protein